MRVRMAGSFQNETVRLKLRFIIMPMVTLELVSGLSAKGRAKEKQK